MLPSDDGPKRPAPTRIVIWVVVAAIAVWFIGSGVVGLLSGG